MELPLLFLQLLTYLFISLHTIPPMSSDEVVITVSEIQFSTLAFPSRYPTIEPRVEVPFTVRFLITAEKEK